MYEVFIERSAERELKKLPEETFRRIIDHIRALSHNPRPAGTALSSAYSCLRALTLSQPKIFVQKIF
ncbi:MAG: hypothetical protein A2162_10745 [Deltaproteobacteria bacterium RBG_13_52_11b]|nr:MAG: hypothetical protein A2162_10745 [Deltaproteobacteria bacterium RBG_13_52_11b]